MIEFLCYVLHELLKVRRVSYLLNKCDYQQAYCLDRENRCLFIR